MLIETYNIKKNGNIVMVIQKVIHNLCAEQTKMLKRSFDLMA